MFLLLFTPHINSLWKVTNLKIFILWIKGVRKKNYVDGFSSWFFFIWLSTFINSNNHYYGISSCFSGSWLCFLSWLSTVIMLWSSFFVTFLANKIKLLSVSILAVSATLDNGAEGYYQIVADSDDLKNRFFFLVSVCEKVSYPSAPLSRACPFGVAAFYLQLWILEQIPCVMCTGLQMAFYIHDRSAGAHGCR